MVKMLKPRLKTLGQRVKPSVDPEQAETQRYRDRDREQPWRHLYFTARWKKLKQFVHERDVYTCQRTGVICLGKYPAPNSPVANHRIRHGGDETLFFDPENIETVSKEYHDSDIQRQERRAQGHGM